VNPQNGDLALGAFDGGTSAITIFPQAAGNAVTYTPPSQNGLPGCAYDNQGNLFCNAFSSGSQSFALFELPSGSTTLQQIAVTTSALAGSMQWDGKYLAFTDGSRGTIEQLQVSGSTGSIVGSTTLNNTGAVWQFWVPGVANESGSEATRAIAPTSASSNDYVGYWNYPAGGNAVKKINNLADPDGVALSVRP
jgi:hypothetical protein